MSALVENENLEKNDDKDLSDEQETQSNEAKKETNDQIEFEADDNKADKENDNKLSEELEALNDSFVRLQAEYANYRRRTQEEKKTIGLFANEKLMADLIPVIDNMERALESFEDKNSAQYQGVDLVYKSLKDSLSKYGMDEIPADIGTDFDHNFHMAVMQEPVEGMEAGKIALVMQKGYKLGNKVLRPTMVKVSS